MGLEKLKNNLKKKELSLRESMIISEERKIMLSSSLNKVSSDLLDIILSIPSTINSYWYFLKGTDKKYLDRIDSNIISDTLKHVMEHRQPTCIKYTNSNLKNYEYKISSLNTDKCFQKNIKTGNKRVIHREFIPNYNKIFSPLLKTDLKHASVPISIYSDIEYIFKNNKEYKLATDAFDKNRVDEKQLIKFWNSYCFMEKKECKIGFYGTNYKNVDSILKNGLQLNYSSNVQLFGIAHYFSDDVIFPIKKGYTMPDENGIHYIIIFLIQTGKQKNYYSSSEKTKKLVRPPHGYDSVKGLMKDSNYIVTYEDSQSIPIGVLKIKKR